MPHEQLLVPVMTAAKLASVGRSTAYELVANGEWPAVRLGRAVRVNLKGLQAWVDRNTRSASDESAA